jgi:hypothetical protein
VDNIKVKLSEVRWTSMDWIDLAQDRNQWIALLKTEMNHRVPYNAENIFREDFLVYVRRLRGLVSVKINFPSNNYSVKFEVFTAVAMKSGVFWDIKTEFVLHRRHVTSRLQSPAS